MRPLALPALVALLLSLSPAAAGAVGLGGRSPIAPTRPSVSGSGPGYFDGKSYQLGFYLNSLFGYESNYRVTTVSVAGSGVVELELGGELRYRPSRALRLWTTLDGRVRVPFSDTGLTEYLVELPVFFLYRFGPGFELSLGNHFAVERSKTPPIFMDVADLPPGQSASLSGTTIRYSAIYESFRPAIAYHFGKVAFIEAGPYFRVKQVNFIENPYGNDPDYRLFDLGADLVGKVFLWRDRISLRVHYDFAHRMFSNYPAKPAAYMPPLADTLTMNRHMVGAQLRFTLFGPLDLIGGYTLRLNRDNGGYFSYLDHLPSAGLALDWRERVQASATFGYLWRGYTDRAICEAQQVPPGSGKWLGGDCKNVMDPVRLSQRESALLFSFRGGVTITSWLQALVSYELEKASSDLEDLLPANHRVLGGLGASL